uniref:Uncharacterized protein LOC111112043 n=1 Tax=Crassostrea virginica TaxID=6565 RepID=A0A8B8BNZ2_CRAVI|nr:uncharacterized protein LOC111112043 [Crassostrea virginica]
MYCEVCHIDLCKNCVVKHLFDTDGFHNVVSLKQFLSTLSYNSVCPTHPYKQCEQHCEECNIQVCGLCLSLGDHDQHKKEDILQILATKKKLIQKDLLEFKKSIYPKYQEAAANIPVQRADVRKHSEDIKTALKKQIEDLHMEIDTIAQGMMTEMDEMDKQYTAVIEKQEHAINKTINEIKQVILDLKSLLNTGDVSLVSKYKSKIEEFRKLPSKLKIFLPNFLPQKINREQLLKQFGSLTFLFIETEEQSYAMPSPGAESSPPARPLLDVPRLITDIPTTEDREQYNLSCLSDDEIWITGDNKIIELYNLKGEVLKSVQTKSGNVPWDIAVTRSGGLVYADTGDRSINLVSGTQIQTLITLRGWTPYGLCSTSSGDLLVIMTSDDDRKQTKVVRYSGSTEKQTMQRDDQGKPLYSSCGIKYLIENSNSDICVSDEDACAVVVVSAAGKLRFRYTGPPSASGESFRPYGITTDSQANILTSDCDNNRIHIIHQDGHFLCFIHNFDLQNPWGLCADSQDYLFVAEKDTGYVKKIQYYKSTD